MVRTQTHSTIYRNLVFPVKRETPVCVVSLVQRTDKTATEIALGVSQVTVIDLEISEAFEKRRQAYIEENHPLREINQVIIGRA